MGVHEKFCIEDHDLPERHTIGPVVPHDDEKIDNTEKGAANGVATLDAEGNVNEPVKKIPTGLDAEKPETPEVGDLYMSTDTGYLNVCVTAASWVAVELTASA